MMMVAGSGHHSDLDIPIVPQRRIDSGTGRVLPFVLRWRWFGRTCKCGARTTYPKRSATRDLHSPAIPPIARMVNQCTCYRMKTCRYRSCSKNSGRILGVRARTYNFYGSVSRRGIR